MISVRPFMCSVNTQRDVGRHATLGRVCVRQCRLSVLDRLLIYVSTSFSDVRRHQSLWAVNVCSR